MEVMLQYLMLDFELVCASKICNILKIVFCYNCVFPCIVEITLVTFYHNMHFRKLYLKKKNLCININSWIFGNVDCSQSSNPFLCGIFFIKKNQYQMQQESIGFIFAQFRVGNTSDYLWGEAGSMRNSDSRSKKFRNCCELAAKCCLSSIVKENARVIKEQFTVVRHRVTNLCSEMCASQRG